jgi:PAS domain S-box-containing protein
MTRGRDGDRGGADLRLRMTEDSLRESEQRSRLATEATGVGIWEWNVKTNVIRWDRQMFAIYGIPPTRDGFVNYDIWAASVLPEDLAEQAELLQRHAREGGINRREFRLRRRDNQEVRIIQAVETVRADSSGEVEWVVGTNLDVTERKCAEEALHESDKRLRLALSGAKAAAWQWNIPTNELIWAPEHSEIYGRDPARELSRYETWRDCLHPDDLESTERLIGDLIRQGASSYRTQYRVVSPSGEIRWLASLGKIDYAPDGAPLRMSGINLDVTEQKRAEQKLTESEMRFRAAQEASLDAFLIFEPVRDDEGRIADLMVVYVNPMAAQYCHSTPERMEGRLLSETLPGAKLPGGIIETHGRIVESGRTQEYVLEYDADGVKGHFRNLVAPFGRYTATTFRDITALVEGNKALAAAKAEAERANLSKSRFLAAASHDLRQPVQSLLLLLAVIERQVADQPKTVEVARMMRMAVDGLHGLLNSVLDISRLDAGVVEPLAECVDLGEIVRKFAAEYEPKAASMALELRCVPRKLQARTDPALLGRVLRNLIENALRYTQKGGVLLAVRRRGALVRIDVIDTGVGIPRDKLSEIFEEFHQLHNPGRNLEQGLGLGLAIVRRLADLLGAGVDVSSRLGRGSRFSLTLPLYRQEPPAASSKTGLEDPGGRVLIIEDNAIVRHGLEILLNQLGYETFLANSSEQALELAAEERLRFDAIVTDQRLGDGLTGIETAREIHRRAARAIPTLVLTGDTGRERIAEIETSGFPFLHKPVDAEDLRGHLARLIERATVGV